MNAKCVFQLILFGLVLSVFECAEKYSTTIKEEQTRYSAKLGETVELSCVINNLKQATVIWQYSSSKYRIPETLAIGNFYYRKDLRIRVKKNTTDEYKQEWNLEIRKLKLNDEGHYFCKVMAEPKSLRREIHLRINVDMEIEPLNPIVEFNEPLTIFCNTSFVKDNSESAQYRNYKRNLNHARIFWFKDGIKIRNEGYRSNKNLTNITIHHYSHPTVSSKLRIHNLNPFTVGKYTCKFRYQNITTNIIEKNTNRRILMGYGFSSSAQINSFQWKSLFIILVAHSFKKLF